MPARTRTAVSGFFLFSLILAAAHAAVPPPANQRPVSFTLDDVWRGDGICYGPHRDGQHPDGSGPTPEQLREDLHLMRNHWRVLRTYAVSDEIETLLRTIRDERLGMKVLVGVWINPERVGDNEEVDSRAAAENRRQSERAAALANQYPEQVLGISVANESQVSWSDHRVRPEVLIEYVRQIRAATRVPITVADDYTFWLEPRGADVAREVDFIHAHIYAMWRGRPLADAIPFTQAQYRALRKLYPEHPLVIGELGWATQMHTEGDQAKYIKGRPGEAEQSACYGAFLAWALRERVPHFWFEAFDEKWKGGSHPDEVEKHWGVFNSDRTPKPAMRPLAVWARRVRAIDWICYSPTNTNPDAGEQPTLDTLRSDLAVLRQAGFNGLITYGASGVLGSDLPRLAEEAGFDGVIMGIWDIDSAEELGAARAAAARDNVLGYCLGNEGLGRRYDLAALRKGIAELKQATGKPVATTEEFDDYFDPDIRAVGDWVFPNTHPIFHGRHDPPRAVRWTAGAYDEQARAGDRFIWFKEVGLPSDGAEDEPYTPADQRAYYEALAETPVMFAYFEAFDQPWKVWRALEPHWGLFDADRRPKPIARRLMEDGMLPRPRLGAIPGSLVAAPPTGSVSQKPPFYVYRDDEAADNHFSPTGLDGDTGDITIEPGWRERPHAGTTCLRVSYAAQGLGPNKCGDGSPCRWATLLWLQPPKNWGDKAQFADQGHDLSGYRRLTFWARVDQPATVRFQVGGLDNSFGDSLTYPRQLVAGVTEDWRQYTIDLTGGDLDHIICGFGWTANWAENPDGFCLYLDDIRYE